MELADPGNFWKNKACHYWMELGHVKDDWPNLTRKRIKNKYEYPGCTMKVRHSTDRCWEDPKNKKDRPANWVSCIRKPHLKEVKSKAFLKYNTRLSNSVMNSSGVSQQKCMSNLVMHFGGVSPQKTNKRFGHEFRQCKSVKMIKKYGHEFQLWIVHEIEVVSCIWSLRSLYMGSAEAGPNSPVICVLLL